MKEIFYYKKYNDLLLSMDSIEDNPEGNRFMSNLFYKFFCESNHVLCISRRLSGNYNNMESIIHNVLEKDNNIKNIQTKRNYEFVSFYMDFSKNVKNVFFNIFSTLWFSYEQPSFIFIKENLKRDDLISFQSKELFSWQDFTQAVDAYVFYKGSREDVIWIGRSERLVIPNLADL